jgi:hypothetical protein
MDLNYVAHSLNRTHLFGKICGFSEDQKSKHHKGTCSKEIELCLQTSITTLHSTMNTIGRTYNIYPTGKQQPKHARNSDTHNLITGGPIFRAGFCRVSIFTHEIESPRPLHFKQSHWWRTRRRSKFVSHYA